MPDPFPRQLPGFPDLRKAYNEKDSPDPSSPVPAPEDIEKMLDELCEAVGEFQDVSDAWAKGTAETYLMEYAQKDVNAARSKISAEVSRLRSQVQRMNQIAGQNFSDAVAAQENVLTKEEADQVWYCIEGYNFTFSAPNLRKKITRLRRLSSDSGTGGSDV